MDKTKIMMMQKLLIFSILSLINIHFSLVYAQQFPKYYQSNLIKVFDENQIELKNPFAGGLKFPVMQNFDLNGDKIQDIVLIDRTDNKILTFINQGNMQFIYSPEYERFFPDSLASFVKFRDYNGDGKMDLFTYAISTGAGIAVYKNISNDVEGIKFKMVSPWLSSFFYGDLRLESEFNLPMFWIDIPEIIDADGDGDLDIFTFDELGGVWLQYYRNISMEVFGNKDSLKYSCIDTYWGNFYETDSSNDVVLNSVRPWGYRNYHENYDSLKTAWGVGMAKENMEHFTPKPAMKKTPVRHAGSTVMAQDMDADGDLDLIIGDVTYPMLNYLQNGKKDDNLPYDKIKKSIMFFPDYDTSVNIRNMPNVNFLDIDNDGVNDMVFSPTDMEIIDTFQSLDQIWLYLNKGSNNNVQLRFNRKDFLQGEMIDLGGPSAPALVDVDADGDLDLVVATKGDFSKTFYQSDRLVLFENTGKTDSTVFILRDLDYLGLSSRKFRDIIPSFGDVDGDQDIDLLLGQANGRLIYYQNSAGPNQPLSLSFVSDNFQNIDIGSYSAPCIHDVNRDGLADLIIGQNAGKLSFYRNTGTQGNPSFTLVSDTFGGIFIPKSDHRTTPAVADLDSNGKDDLIIGMDILNPNYAVVRGQLLFYKDISAVPGAVFEKADSLIRDFQSDQPLMYSFGNLLRPVVACLDGDQRADILLGNSRGGLLFFGTNTNVSTKITANKSLTLCSGDSITLDAGEGFDSYKWSTGATTRKITVKEAKTYSCEVRKGSFSSTAYITIRQHPGTIDADFSYQANERKVSFTALNDNIKYIHWDFGDGGFSFDLNPVHQYVQQGTYRVCMSLSDWCGAADKECQNIFVSSSLSEDQRARMVKVFPNPFDNKIIISIEAELLNNPLKITIFNSVGQVVYQKQSIDQPLFEIPTSEMQNGFYLVEIQSVDGGEKTFVKLLKM